MKYILIILVTFLSCSKKAQSKFEKIKYTRAYNYIDSLALKIDPNKDYNYWAFSSYNQQYDSEKNEYKVLKQNGDIKYRKLITDFKPFGFFESGHPNYRCNYVLLVNKGIKKYICNNEEFRKFLGTVDNLEEAMLLARTYGYILDTDIKGSAYRIKDDTYELHLMKFYEYPPQKESVEIKIDRKGNIKTKSLGIYCKGEKCYE